jgi:hypothetical protein
MFNVPSFWAFKILPESFQGILDLYPTDAVAGYSISRRLTKNYSGALIRVRRASDNIEQDIGFNSNNELDTASIISFCGASSGFVARVYPQLTTTNPNYSVYTQYLGNINGSSQPEIYNGSSVLTRNGRPIAKFNVDCLMTSNGTWGNSVVDQFAVFGMWDTAYYGTRNFISGFGENYFMARTEGNDQSYRGILGFNVSTALGVFTNLDLGAVNVLMNGTNSAVYRNNTIVSGGINLGTNSSITFVIGGRSFSGGRDVFDRDSRMTFCEFIAYNRDTAFDRGLITQNQKDFYNI